MRSTAVLRTASALAMCLLMIGALAYGSAPASAAPVSAPVNQCNNITASNVGGQGVSCTVTVVNYVTASGGLDATTPSTVTVTVCTGAAGPIGAGAGTCSTTTSISAAPVLSVTQCDGVSNGGGGVLICTVTMTNHFSGTPASAPTPATVYQCIGSVITGPGAPGTCTPANTPGVTSVTAANVGQCNGSGNGGTNVGFICTVSTGSTASSSVPVNIDQCNGSANGGGSLTQCQATISSIIAVAATAAPTATPVAATATPARTVAPTARAVAGLPSTSTASDQTAPLAFAGLVLVLIGGLVLRARRLTPPIK